MLPARCLLLFVLLGSAGSLPAAEAPPRRTLEALRTGTAPVVDGRLDEALWQRAQVAAGFVQRAPEEGAPSSFETTVRVAYDDHHVYVGAHLEDPEPAAIRRQLARRDVDHPADLFAVFLDSYHDRRTAYGFGVSAAGVQRDAFYFDDVKSDLRWDAVWRSAVRIDEAGWTVELAIPLSQLRFNGDASVWGVQFVRLVARTGEHSLWQPIPRSAGVDVSAYGELRGLTDLEPPGYLEVRPYAAAGALLYRPEDPADPFHPGSELHLGGGLDVKLGMGSNWTLDATLNPDFGQVEADPAQVNLTDTQLFFEERRPFFLEGLSVFGAAAPGETTLFYSRRIGGPPVTSFDPPSDDAYVDAPTQTTILGAAKVTGRSASGTSVGVLEAVTAPAWERYAGLGVEPGAMRRVAPLANFFIARLQQDLDGGNSQVGALVTAVNRNLDAELAGQLPRAAYAGSADFNLGLENKRLYVSGRLAGSHVLGTPEVMEALQTNFSRYAQRPDAAHVSVDAEARALSGWSGDLRIGDQGSEHFIWELRSAVTSPFFEVNDLGFQNRADEMTLGARVTRRDQKAKGWTQDWRVGLDLFGQSNTGGDLLGSQLTLFSGLTTQNFQPLEAALWINSGGQSDRLLRGGPLAATPSELGGSIFGGTDGRAPLRVFAWVWAGATGVGARYGGGGFELIAEPLDALTISLAPEVSMDEYDAQYVDDYEDPAARTTYGTRYVFSELAKVSSTLSGRVAWTFSPVLSLQTHLRATVVTGAYGPLAWFTRPRQRSLSRFGEEGGALAPVEGGYEVRGPGSEVTAFIEEPDFTFSGVQANAVLRWEWRPGSTLFLVYQLDCTGSRAGDGVFSLAKWGQLCTEGPPSHALLLKGTWWWGL